MGNCPAIGANNLYIHNRGRVLILCGFLYDERIAIAPIVPIHLAAGSRHASAGAPAWPSGDLLAMLSADGMNESSRPIYPPTSGNFATTSASYCAGFGRWSRNHCLPRLINST